MDQPLHKFLLVLMLVLTGTLRAEPESFASSSGGAAVKFDARSLELNERGIKAVKGGDFAGAEQLFKEALAADSRNLTAVFNLSGVLLNRRKPKEAVELLLRYTGDYKKDAGLFARLGDCYFASHELKSAVSAYEQALAVDPDYPAIANRLGTVYGLLQQLDKAEKAFLNAIRQNAVDGEALGNLAALYVALNEPGQAVSTAKRALQVAPSAGLYVTLGAAYELQNDRANAVSAYKRAIDLGDKRPALAKKVVALSQP